MVTTWHPGHGADDERNIVGNIWKSNTPTWLEWRYHGLRTRHRCLAIQKLRPEKRSNSSTSTTTHLLIAQKIRPLDGLIWRFPKTWRVTPNHPFSKSDIYRICSMNFHSNSSTDLSYHDHGNPCGWMPHDMVDKSSTPKESTMLDKSSLDVCRWMFHEFHVISS